jgi:glucose/arabinose dehydrogenase
LRRRALTEEAGLSRRRSISWLLAGAAILVAACGGDPAPDEASPAAGLDADAAGLAAAAPAGAAPTVAPPAGPLGAVGLATTPVADIPLATALAARPADGRLYVTSQEGRVWRIDGGGSASVVLDLTARVSPHEPGSERGLLGLAFNPVDGRLFVYFTDVDVQSHVVSYAVGPDGVPDPASAWTVIDIPQPGVGHKGGGMSFDETGVLYLALGDGGGSNGRDAQDYTKLLGGIIRITPSTTGPGYVVPADNPFLADPARRPELWAKGLRNPWGFWRDPASGDLWLGDVGESTVEELDRIPAGVAGVNLGWYHLEGNEVNEPGAPADALAPVFTYRHDEIGPAIIGGRIYRGASIPALRGAYVFADMAGVLFALGAGDEVVRLGLTIPQLIVTGFGDGLDGELYVLTLQGGVLRLGPA